MSSAARLLGVVAFLSLLAPGSVSGQPSPCADPAYRQFDFWLGHWQVTTADGRVAGENRIRMAENGCVLTERYTTPSGFQGQSLNIFDRRTKRWHQTWVDNTGLLLQLDGGLENGSMVMSGPGVTGTGAALTHRITWTPNADGTVRQHWQSQEAAAAEWQTLFDGLYRPLSVADQ
jgi:hypothetical protein